MNPEGRRTLLALALSPALLPTAVFAYALYEGWQFSESMAVAALYAAFTYSGMLVLGYPAHLLLARWGFTSLWSYTLSGLLIGLLILGAFVLANSNIAVSLNSVLIFAGFGAATAAVFWRLFHPRTR